MPTRSTKQSQLEDRIFERLNRRNWPIVVSVIYVILGLIYYFRWGSVVGHVPSDWRSPQDLWETLSASSSLAAGDSHASAHWVSEGFGGRMVLLVPLALFRNSFGTTLVLVKDHGHLVAHPLVFSYSGVPLVNSARLIVRAKEYAIHPHVFLLLATYALILTCTVLFSCDALAERLGVSKPRRAFLCFAEAALLWNITVLWGHPEDAVALALALYALTFALDERYSPAGWLFGLAVAVQPLVLVMFPILLVMAGKSRALGLVIRSIIPAALITVPFLVVDFHQALHALATQPINSDIPATHQTPWTFLAPKLGGHGATATVGTGPLRFVGLALAVGLGWWTLRWRNRPEMIVWAVALAFALRTFTESVLTSYYSWPALAVGLVVAARRSTRRFGIAMAIALVTTLTAQWHWGVYPWWLMEVAGVSGLLLVAAQPEPVGPSELRAKDPSTPSSKPGRTSSAKSKRKKRSRTL